MKRFYYISDDLDDLATIERELKSVGIPQPQVHVFSQDDAGIEKRHMNNVQEFMKRDVVHSALVGATIGFIAAVTVLVLVYFSGLPAKVTWIPFIFLALILFGFFTWEGGFFGIQVPHHELENFETALREGKHILFVDANPHEAKLLAATQAQHPRLKLVRKTSARPSWVIQWQRKWRHFIRSTP